MCMLLPDNCIVQLILQFPLVIDILLPVFLCERNGNSDRIGIENYTMMCLLKMLDFQEQSEREVSSLWDQRSFHQLNHKQWCRAFPPLRLEHDRNLFRHPEEHTFWRRDCIEYLISDWSKVLLLSSHGYLLFETYRSCGLPKD